MKTHAVISEFNPFHSGHKYLIDTLKADGSAVVAVISGSFVERGDVAIIDKYARAEAAVLSGVDLAVELPAPWCFSGAEFFALGGVAVANGLGVVDSLAFGSESGDIRSLTECAARLSSDEFTTALATARTASRDKGIASLRAEVYAELYGKSEHFDGSNDLLGLEYIRALQTLGSDITPTTVKRIGEVYNSKELCEICSATAIRHALAPDARDFSRRDLSHYMPKTSYDILARELAEGRRYDLARLDAAVLARLRAASPSDIASIMEVSGGMENRLITLSNECRTINELVELAKGKHYSASRVRRVLIATLLGVTMRDIEAPPLFTSVLAANERGRELLSLARKSANIAVLSKMSDARELCGTAAEQYALHMRAERIAELCCIGEPRKVGAVMI